jgi:hypothetical protein
MDVSTPSFRALVLIDCFGAQSFKEPFKVVEFYHRLVMFTRQLPIELVFDNVKEKSISVLRSAYPNAICGGAEIVEKYVETGKNILVGGCEWGECTHYGHQSFEVLYQLDYNVFTHPDILFTDTPNFHQVVFEDFENDRYIKSYRHRVWKKVGNFYQYITK